MTGRVAPTLRDGIADIRLNRPAKMNALDPGMFVALLDVGEALAHDNGIRAVVLSGEGRAFCAGLEMQTFERMGNGETLGGDPDGPFSSSPPCTA